MEETKHLSQGSSHPPLKKGSLRIYNMRFCPYAQRALLVAEAKQLEYDVVNVNLTTKPEWFVGLTPKGQVPTLEFEDGSYLTESLIVCDFMDENFKESTNQMYPTDPRRKATDRLLVERFNDVVNPTYKTYFEFGKPEKERDFSHFDIVLKELAKYEIELKKRGTKFFSGEKPGMVDYMIWPWFERSGIIMKLGGDKMDIYADNPQLRKWTADMMNDGAVKKWYMEVDAHAHYLLSRFTGQPDYDYLLNKM